MATGCAWLVVAVSELAMGVMRLSSSSMTLSMMIFASLAPKPRRSKYRVAAVPGVMLLMSILTVRGVLRAILSPEVFAPTILTLSLKYELPDCWRLRRESVWVSPLDVPSRGVRVRASRRATSKASLGAKELVPRWVSRMVNCRYLACWGIMKDWVKLLLNGESSVRTAAELRMVAAPRVVQPYSGLLVSVSEKLPLVMSARSIAVSGACRVFPPSPHLPIPPSLLRMALIICRLSHDGSLRTPGDRVLFIRS